MLPTLTTAGLTPVADAHVVLVSRLSADEAELLATTMRLGPADVDPADPAARRHVRPLVAGAPRYLWFATTSIEEELLGRPVPESA